MMFYQYILMLKVSLSGLAIGRNRPMPEMTHWIVRASNHFLQRPKVQATDLALWGLGLGLILARSCGLTTVAGLLVPLLGQSFNTVRERLRDTYREADAKAGSHRRTLAVASRWKPGLGNAEVAPAARMILIKSRRWSVWTCSHAEAWEPGALSTTGQKLCAKPLGRVLN